MKKIKFQIIKIEDHYSDNADWINPDDYIPERKYLEYTGWVVQEDDSLVTLAQGRSKEDRKDAGDKRMLYDNLMHIMKKTILSRRTITI